MPRFEPFAGLRYAPGVDLADVTAPPYDVLDDARRDALQRRSPYNAVRVDSPAPGASEDRYEDAACRLRDWLRDGVLVADEHPVLTAYRMTFVDDTGAQRRLTGAIGALELVPPGEGGVLPHERTTPAAMHERLALQRACRANLSPIWGLSSAGAPIAAALTATGDGSVSRARTAQPAAVRSFTDDDGVLHEVWPVDDPDTVRAVTDAVAAGPVVLADGHHRYRTGLRYRRERRQANAGAPGPYDLIMAWVVDLTAAETSVRPMHRLLDGLPPGADPVAVLSAYFELSPLPVPGGDGAGVDGRAGGGDPGPVVAAMAAQEALGVVTAGGRWLARPRPATDATARDDVDSRRLDVALAGLGHVRVRHQAGAAQVLEAVRTGDAQVGVLLRPPAPSVIATMAAEGRLMPPKSTFFYPKPATGVVFRPLDETRARR